MPTDMARKPGFHFVAPHSWMNDPCGPGYDPATGKYHLFYQWNPKSCAWGYMTWGHATSKDLVTWEYVSADTPALKPDGTYDKEGVWTGCLLPRGINGEDKHLSVIYTSVCHLPIEWNIPYVRASEGLAAATSTDGGRTWCKLQQNPIVKEEPADLDVTGWRDPCVASWDRLNCIRGSSSLYGVVSGGVRHKGPTVFLYTVRHDDLSHWEYIGPLLDLPKHFRSSAKWGGDFGLNLECTNFMTLVAADGTARDFLITGSQGAAERDWVTSYLAEKPSSFPRRTTRYMLWLSGTLQKKDSNGGVILHRDFDGILDHGCYYAANSFQDPVSNRRIVWGWLPEEDVPLTFCEAKGWNGCLALPRELFLLRLPGVVSAMHTPLQEITSMLCFAEEDGVAFTVETLGIRPLSELDALCSVEPQVYLRDVQLPTVVGSPTFLTPVKSANWKMEATVSISQACRKVGFHIRHTGDMATKTTISFSPPDEEIVVDRSKSSHTDDVNKSEERGSFTLLTMQTGEETAQESWRVTMFCDNGVVEVYANDRFVLSTMIYTMNPDAVGVSLFAEGSSGAAAFSVVKFWTGLKSVCVV